MIKRAVRNLHSTKPNPPRVFDVIVDNGKVKLQIKLDKNKYEYIPWDDVVKQVEIAKEISIEQKLSQIAP